jgi:hypothetical protein
VRYSDPPPQIGTISTQVQILLMEPQVPHVKLGEVLVDAPGNVSREQLEANVKSGAANLGADAAWIMRDDTKLFPIVYVDPGSRRERHGQRPACCSHCDQVSLSSGRVVFVTIEGQGAGRSSDGAPDRGGRHAGAGARFSMRFCQ